MPFPGGAEAALEFAAFEKGMLERGSGRGRDREPPVERQAIERQAPLSEPPRHSGRWMLAGAGMAITAAIVVLLLSSGLLAAGLAAIGWAAAPS